MSDDDLVLELEPDPDWYEVPYDPDEDVDAWALGLVQRLAGPEADPELVASSATVVALHARAARDPQAEVELSFLYLPDPLDEVVAQFDVEVLLPRPGQTPSLPELEALLRRPAPDHLDTPEVSRGLLPSGEAVRQRVLRADGPDARNVLETVTWVVQPADDADLLLRLTTSWRTVVQGDLLGAAADRMAGALVLADASEG